MHQESTIIKFVNSRPDIRKILIVNKVLSTLSAPEIFVAKLLMLIYSIASFYDSDIECRAFSHFSFVDVQFLKHFASCSTQFR